MPQNQTRKILIVSGLIAAVVIVMAIKHHSKPTDATIAEEHKQAETPADKSKQSSDKQTLPTLIDLGAGKCVPCKMMAPILEELETEYANTFRVVFIDVWKNPDEAKKYGIKMIPTQIFYDAAGNELFRHEGFFSKEDILTKWKEFGIDLENEG